MSSLSINSKNDFFEPLFYASEGTTENGGGEGSIFILVGNPYRKVQLTVLEKFAKSYGFLKHFKQFPNFRFFRNF